MTKAILLNPASSLQQRRRIRTPLEMPSTIPAAQPFDGMLEVLTLTMLAFAPAALGAVRAWSEEVVLVLAAAATVLFVLRLWFCPQARFIWSWSYAPVALFAALAAFQLLPLPSNVLAVLSPHTVALRADLLGEASRGTGTLSLYPQATRHDLRLLMAAAAMFIIAIHVYARPQALRRLLIGVALIGGLSALLALAQDWSGAQQIYWLIPSALPQARAGSFIHYNHFSQFTNLTIAAALALLLLVFHDVFGASGRAMDGIELRARLRDPRMRAAWLWGGIVVAGAVAIVLSLSRGGTLSLALALIATSAALAAGRRLGRAAWALALVAGLIFGCAAYFGLDRAFDRLTTLQNFASSYENRWQIVRDVAAEAWPRFPIFGTGLGTHEVVYPMFDRSSTTALATHAENEYVQMLEETGALGLGLVLVFVGIVAAAYLRAVRGGRRVGATRGAAIAAGLGFGLIAILIHSFSDFGQHLPANAMLTAVWCAVLVSLGRTPPQPLSPAIAAAPARRHWSLIALAAAILVVFGWVVAGADAARRAEGEWGQAQSLAANLVEANWKGDDAVYADLLTHAAAAAKDQPGDVHYRYALNVFRWHSISRETDPVTGGVLIYPDTQNFAGRIADDLREAEQLCPTFGALHCLAGQLRATVLEDSSGDAEIARGYQLARCDATACFCAAMADLRQHHPEQALEKLKRARALGQSFGEVASAYLAGGGSPESAVGLAGNDAGERLQLADLLSKAPGGAEIAEQVRASAQVDRRAELEHTSLASDAPAGSLAELASLCAGENNLSRAVDLYRRALAQDYGRDDWRLALAKALVRTGQIRPALTEARVCLHHRPDLAEARQLVAELTNTLERKGQPVEQ